MLHLCGFYYFSIILAIVMLSTEEKNYCDICPNHTICLYKEKKSVCNPVVNGLKPEEKKKIVKMHNEFRQNVASGNETRGAPGPQPPAKKMPNLVWDEELEITAQRWANQCTHEHDRCRDVKRFPVGQNIASFHGERQHPVSIETLVTVWYNEVELLNPAQIESYIFDTRIGHYSQMLWANTTNIGCGFIIYLKGSRQKDALLVCNYGPPGNYKGKKIYDVAEKKKEENEVLEKDEEEKRASHLRYVLLHAKSILLPVLNGIFRSK